MAWFRDVLNPWMYNNTWSRTPNSCIKNPRSSCTLFVFCKKSWRRVPLPSTRNMFNLKKTIKKQSSSVQRYFLLVLLHLKTNDKYLQVFSLKSRRYPPFSHPNSPQLISIRYRKIVIQLWALSILYKECTKKCLKLCGFVWRMFCLLTRTFLGPPL